MLYVFFWVIPWCLNFICRCFGTLCLFQLHRQAGVIIHLLAYEDGTECSETLAYKIQTPENYPEENIQQIYVSCSKCTSMVQHMKLLCPYIGASGIHQKGLHVSLNVYPAQKIKKSPLCLHVST
jgi:hypothetical protein